MHGECADGVRWNEQEERAAVPLPRRGLSPCNLIRRRGPVLRQHDVGGTSGECPAVRGRIRRDGPKWKRVYLKRQAVERTFKSLKESRRLNRHCVRGLKKVTLHASMSVLSYQATALAWMGLGQEDRVRWMVPKVA